MNPKFRPGRNMAMKVPAHEYDKTVAFYRDVLGFELIPLDNEEDNNTIRFKFGERSYGLIVLRQLVILRSG